MSGRPLQRQPLGIALGYSPATSHGAPVTFDLALATGLWATGFFLFGRFIAPRWKVIGKLLFYLLVTALLSWTVGSYAVIWVIGHPLLGVGGQIWWCRRRFLVTT